MGGDLRLEPIADGEQALLVDDSSRRP